MELKTLDSTFEFLLENHTLFRWHPGHRESLRPGLIERPVNSVDEVLEYMKEAGSAALMILVTFGLLKMHLLSIG